MTHGGTPFGLTPMLSTTIHMFMNLYRELCPTVDDEAPVEQFAQRLGWSVARVQQVAAWCRDHELVDTDAGMGHEIRILEGRNGT